MEYERYRYICEFCKGSFDKLENLNKHVQHIHTVHTSTKENRICSLCGAQCLKIEGYRNHLRHLHGRNEEGQVYAFKCFNDFLMWKNDLEKKNYCKYGMRMPPKRLQSGEKIHVYQCDSSDPSSKEKKTGVAVKENCPALISAIESAKTHGVKVEIWDSHVGHVIPNGEGMNSIISSFGVAEITYPSDQSYHSVGMDENIFILPESSNSSFSESFGSEFSKKKNSRSRDKTKKIKLCEDVSQSFSQKFAYKKDPSKKTGSMCHSLASVACMKASTKKKVETSALSTVTDSVTEAVSTISSSSSNTQVTSSVEEISNEVSVDCSISDFNCKPKTEENRVLPVSPHKAESAENDDISITPDMIGKQPTFAVIGEGPLSGHVVLLNTVPPSIKDQTTVHSPNQNLIPIGSAISVETVPTKKDKPSNNSEINNIIPDVVIYPVASENEKILPIKNISGIVQNPNSFKDSKVSSPSILKKIKKVGQNSIKKYGKKNTFVSGKDTSVLGKRKASPEKNIYPVSPKPILPSNIINSIHLVSSTPNMSTSNIKGIIPHSVPLKETNSVQHNNSTPSNSISNFTSTVPVYSNSKTRDSLPTSKDSTGNQTVLSSFPPGQAFMSINNNLIPIGTLGTPILQSNLNSSFVLTSTVPTSPIIRPIQTAANFTPLTSRLPVTSANASLQTLNSKVLDNEKLPAALPASGYKDDTGTSNIVLIPQTKIGSSVSFSSPLMSYSIRTTTSNSVGPNRIQPIISNPLVSGGINSVIPRPLISSGIGPVFTRIAPGTQIISTPLLPTNTQFIPAPLLTNQRNSRPILQTKGSSLPSSLIGQPSIAIVTSTNVFPKSIISTTVSNAVKVQKVNLPVTKNVKNPSVPVSKKNKTTIVSEHMKVSNVVINTQPIISTPAINIPQLSSIAPQKPGAFIFESSGDVYMLEPVDENVQSKKEYDQNVEKTSMSVCNSNEEISSDLINNSDKIVEPAHSDVSKEDDLFNTTESACSDTSKEDDFSKAIESSSSDSSKEGGFCSIAESTPSDTNKDNELCKSTPLNKSKEHCLSNLHLEKGDVVENQNNLDVKTDGKLKSLSPSKMFVSSPLEPKNSVQIKSITQEKRPLKDDDIEILKKVKYYQMEMKYLNSLAECKQLKLELAKAQMKNREMEERRFTDRILNNQLEKGTSNTDVFVQLTENLESKRDTNINELAGNLVIDIDSLNDQDSNIRMNINKCIEIIETDQSSHSANQENNNINLNNHCKHDNNLDKKQLDSKISNDLESKTDDIENKKGDFEDQNMDCNDLDNQTKTKEGFEEHSLDISDEQSYDCNLSDQINSIDSDEEKSVNTNESDSVSISKCIENNTKTDQSILDTEPTKQFSDKENDPVFLDSNTSDKEINFRNSKFFKENPLNSNAVEKSSNTNCELSALQNLDEGKELKCINNEIADSIKSKDKEIQDAISCEVFHHDAIKELESRYKTDECLDIFTMIRTSVLRGLHDEVKTLYDENEKLHEMLKKRRSRKNHSQ
ncbi:hypothetical protein CDAR_553021 [Caerostris darwini]|uniref:C2H2-type domain-containing protein n=1 Tax=Caerostris darwini TaxID=1538125 RepID=A0AAV4WCL5_9ARAC|nr:hypothetical protein CDAR_553021 [Caerostris darwini]